MKINNILSYSLLLALGLTSCSDSFLEEKKNYNNVDPSIYDYYDGVNIRVSDIYSWCLPSAASGDTWNYPSNGSADRQSRSTEEYSGFDSFVDPDGEMFVMNGNRVPDYFHNQSQNIQASVWGRIRNINDAIRGIEAGALPQEQKDEFLGQVYFFRAWCYFQIVKWYGGIPIVRDVLDPVAGVQYPRASTQACIEFIIDDLNTAAAKMGTNIPEWGRVSAATALALKGRVLLWWASPIFNRTNDQTRWDQAYAEMTKDLETINKMGYGLYKATDGMNGASFAGMFCQSGFNPEALFVTLYNTIEEGDKQKNNTWERTIRPKNTTGSGLNPSAMLVDLFPMSDGHVPASAGTYTKLDASAQSYEAEYPFMNRDPRFYRTFAFPGSRWAYKGDAVGTVKDPVNLDNPSYNKGRDYTLWNYCWYTEAADRDNVQQSGYFGDNLLKDGKGMYVRKRSDDLDVNSSPLYNWIASSSESGFRFSAAPYIELRYAEVLLNLAEVCVGSNHLTEAVDYLKQIRQRAGYAIGAEGLEGVDAAQDKCMSAVLYERQIELAYEGKRFDDMRRWMLFDGGANFDEVQGAPASWHLTGWGGNTCTWLGVTPMNGQRRENMEFRLRDELQLGGTTKASDPLAKFISFYQELIKKCDDKTQYADSFKLAGFDAMDASVDYLGFVSMDLRDSVTTQQTILQSFYQQYLVRKMKKGDSYDSNQNPKVPHFFAKYYLLGLPQGALNSDKGLLQTIGWDDSNNGGANGTFDPLK